jgi:hypothetical protein
LNYYIFTTPACEASHPGIGFSQHSGLANLPGYVSCSENRRLYYECTGGSNEKDQEKPDSIKDPQSENDEEECAATKPQLATHAPPRQS